MKWETRVSKQCTTCTAVASFSIVCEDDAITPLSLSARNQRGTATEGEKGE